MNVFFVFSAALIMAFMIVYTKLGIVYTASFILLLFYIYNYLKNLKIWQQLTALALLGFAVLNFGFTNYMPLGLPLGHVLLLLAFLLCGAYSWGNVKNAANSKLFVPSALLFSLSLLHLVINVQDYGVYAIRDANFSIELWCLFLGYIWARELDYKNDFLVLLATLFIVNFIYSLTYPISDWLLLHSPESGVFREVPLLGHYAGTGVFLIMGGFFSFLVAKTHWGKYQLFWFYFGLLQFGWAVVFQDRSMYVGLVVSVLILFYLGHITKILRIAGSALVGLMLLFWGLTFFDVEITGRVDAVSASFLFEHVLSLFLLGDTAGVGTTHWRIQLLTPLFEHWTSNIKYIIYGQGFGLPLINFVLDGVDVRQPHNTYLTILVRLGIIGFVIWLTLMFRLLMAPLKVAKRRDCDLETRLLSAWFLIFGVLGTLHTLVQPWLEFSYGAVPFFIVMGFAFGWSSQFSSGKNTMP